MVEIEDFDGRLVRAYYIQCAIADDCGNWTLYFDDPTPNMRDAEKHFRKHGWSKTKRYGWVCPNHGDDWRKQGVIERYETDAGVTWYY